MYKLLPLFLVLILVMAPDLALAQVNWSMFRGDPSLSGVAAQALNPPLHVAWSSQVGPVESTSAIVGGVVYSAAMTGKLRALNLANGKIIWVYSSRNAFSASPCLLNGVLYIGDEGGVFYALRAATGKLLFKFATGDKIVSSATPASGGRVLFGSWDGFLYCVDGRTGRKCWSFKTDAQVNATPSVFNGTAIIAGCDGKVRALDLKSGSEREELNLGGNIGASPAVCNRRLYIGSLGGIYIGMSPPYNHASWKMRENEEDAACYASAAVTSNAVIFGSRSNRIFRVDPSTGKPAWAVLTKGEVNASPTVAGNVVWAGSDDGTLLAIDLASGRVLWRFVAGGEIKGSPAIGQGCLVIGTTDGMLYCLKR